MDHTATAGGGFHEKDVSLYNGVYPLAGCASRQSSAAAVVIDKENTYSRII